MPYVGGTAQRVDPQFLVDRLVRNGLSRMQAAAIVGNMQRESQLITNNLNREEGSYGLMQWRGPRFQALQQFAAQTGQPWTDPGVQADFMAYELRTSEANNARAFNQARTLDEATRSLQPVVRYNKNPATAGVEDRLAAARNAYGGDPDAPAVAPAVSLETAPQRQGAQPAVSRETSAYQAAYDDDYRDPYGPRAKGLRGGLASLGDLGAAYINRQRRLGQPLLPQGLGLGAQNPAPNPTPSIGLGGILGTGQTPQTIPGMQSYTEPATGNRMATGLPGRYEQGDVLNLGQAPPEQRFPGGRVPLPRARPLAAPGDATAYRDEHLDMGESVADARMGALVDPYMGFDYG